MGQDLSDRVSCYVATRPLLQDSPGIRGNVLLGVWKVNNCSHLMLTRRETRSDLNSLLLRQFESFQCNRHQLMVQSNNGENRTALMVQLAMV